MGPDAIDYPYIRAMMVRLTDELRQLVDATKGDKGFVPLSALQDEENREAKPVEMVSAMHSRLGMDPRVAESKEINAAIHRASSALLDVEDQLGPIKLALLVSAIAERDHDLPTLPAGTPEILTEHYPDMEFATVPDYRCPQPRRSWVPSSNTVVLTLVIASDLLALGACTSAYIQKKTELRAALNEEITLETADNLTRQERIRLLQLQKIEIPELREGIPLGLLEYGLIAVLLAGTAYCAHNARKEYKERQAEPKPGFSTHELVADMTRREGQIVFMEAMRQLDDTLKIACENGRFTLPYLSPKNQMER